MPNLFVILLIIFSFSLISYPANAAINIQRTGPKNYPTIQKAFDAARDGDIIFLSGGTYTGLGNGYNISLPNIPNLTLRGKSSTETVISGEDLGRVFNVANSVNLTIEALTIKNGKVRGNGAGIFLAGKSKLWLKNVKFTNCTARGNSILAGTGGAIRSSGSEVYARDCAFVNNSATFNGGVACGGNWDAMNCVFNGNSSGGNGGVAWEGKWKTTNCYFYSNSNKASGGIAEVENWEAINCVFDSNSASFGGVAWGGTWNVTNCTFYNNNANKGAVAYSVNWNAVNSIFWGGNNQFLDVTGSIKYCDVQGTIGWLYSYGCISANPLFKNVKTRDYNLQIDSPCIDAGTSEGAPAMDIKGNDRPYPPNDQDLFYDMGAYECYRAEHDIYVSPTGNDSNAGTKASPLRTIRRALDLVGEGGTILLNKGLYTGPVRNWPKYIQDITIKSLSGTWEGAVVSGRRSDSAFDLSTVPAEIRGTIEGITITAGSSESGGGILFSENSNIVLKNCLVEDNFARQGGGAYGGKAINCIFSNNTALSGGGTFNSHVESCKYFGNSAGEGGGIYTDRANDKIINCLLVKNSGNGIYIDNDSSMINCTLYNNAPNNIYTNNGQAAIRNCISWNGAVDAASGMTNSASYSDIQSGNYSSLNMNISSDPKFVSGPKNNFYLSPGSPCINSGTLGEGIPATDMDGRLRLSAIDMGAYKYWEANVDLIQPGKAGISVEAENKYTIKWKTSDRSGNPANYPYASLYLSIDKGETWQTIGDNFTPNASQTYDWLAPAVLSDKCKIAVEIAKVAGYPISRSESVTCFAIKDSAPPKITLGGMPRYLTSSYDIIWKAADPFPATNPVTLELSTNGGGNWSVLAYDQPESGVYTFTLDPGISIPYPYCKIRVYAHDMAGNISSKDFVFGIDTQAPTAEISMTTEAVSRMVAIRIVPYDERGIKTIRIKVDESAWQEYSSKYLPSRITLEPPTNGTHYIAFEFYDLANNVTTETRSVDLVLPETPEVTSVLVDGIDAARTKELSKTPAINIGINDYQSNLKDVNITVKIGSKESSASAPAEQSANDVAYYTASAKMSIPSESAAFNVIVEAKDAQDNVSTFKTSALSTKETASAMGRLYNIPNPFRPSRDEATMIMYGLSANTDIKLNILDSKGKAVWQRSFSPGAEGGKKGQNNIFWNGKNDLGQYVENGVYSFNITSGGMILARGQMTVTD